MHLPPGPKSAWQLFKTLIERTKDPIEFYNKTFGKYGNVVFFKLGSYKFLMLRDSQAVEQVLHTDSAIYTKSTGYERFKLILGNGLLISEGETWKKQRRLMSWAFATKYIEKVFPVMVSETISMVEGWKDKKEIDLAQEMNSVTLQVISQSLFGKRHQADDSQLVRSALQNILEYLRTTRHLWIQLILSPLPFRDKRKVALKVESALPLRDTRNFFNSIKKMDSMVEAMIEHGRKNKELNNFLNTMIQATDSDDHSQMNNQQLRDEVISILVAGHETTANALSWTWQLLLSHPEVFAKVRQEIISVFGNKDPSFEDISKLEYTKAVFEESMRMFPPFWRISRKNTTDAKIAGYDIPANTTVIVAIFSIHRSPEYWDQPDIFNPDRFFKKPKSDSRYTYIPFGAGARACVGSQFAMVEALTILSICIKHYDFEKKVPGIPEMLASLTLQPKNGCKVFLKKAGEP